VQVSASSLGNTSQHVLIEALPPVLVTPSQLRPIRFGCGRYNEDRKVHPLQFAPELEIPFGCSSSTTLRATALQTLWSALPSRRICRQRALYGRSSPERRQQVVSNTCTGEIWLHIDNEAVRSMRHEDVFGEHGTERAADKQCAYLPFYCRASLIGTSCRKSFMLVDDR
jgi:hypothetical protein